jgi:hypothetical protein
MAHADELLDAAHDYIERGLSVIALTGKQPNTSVHKRGLYDAFSKGHAGLMDRHAAFTHPNTTGIGILTGGQFDTGGGYYVVDIDGEDGAAQWKALVGSGEYIPDRWAAKTGRGLHLWVADIEPWPTVKLGSKLDFKGVGGYVAAPPSIHPDGHPYTWLLPPADESPMEMPEPLLAELRKRKALRDQAMIGKSMRKPVPVEDRIPGMIYNDVSHEGVIQKVREGGEGNRNNLLFWAAATLKEEGASQADFDRLLDAAVEAGLPRFEARRTMTSAIRSVE